MRGLSSYYYLVGRWAHLFEDPLGEQRRLLGRHHKVVRLVAVVNNVLEVDARLLVQVLHSTNKLK